MSTGLNVHHVIGNLGEDAELRFTQDNTPVVSFRAACGERYRKQDGSWDERVDWINCVLFGRRAVGLSKFLLKGTRIYATGKVRSHQYVSQKDGIERTAWETRCTDIIVLSTPEGRQIRKEPEALASALASDEDE